jgi:hypothetical protein
VGRSAPPVVFSEALPSQKPSSGSTAAYLRRKAEKRAGQRLGPDELAAQKRRVSSPETEDEMEYASRPVSAGTRRDAQSEFEQEKRGRGVRGAGRSGARLRNEPVLTDMDRLATENAAGAAEFSNQQRRAGEIAGPARKSGAFYGSGGGRLGRVMEGVQFYKFDPVLGQAFSALQGGDDAGAREILKGFSSKLAGADPRQRKKFFRLFRNVENVPQELLEKDAALRSLFAQIHVVNDPNFVNVKSANTIAGGGGGPKGAASTRRAVNPVDRAIAELNAGTMTREEFQRRFPTLRRAGGGDVLGIEHGYPSEPVSVKTLAKYRDIDRSKTPRMPGDHGYLDQLTAAMRSGKDLGPVILQHDPATGETVLFDGNHRLAAAERLGMKSIQTQMRVGNKMGFLPSQFGHRAGGGPVGGGLAARIAAAQAKQKGYLVGEQHEELYVGRSGRVGLVGQNGPEIRTFPEDGRIEPHVPEWIRRGLKAKDFTGRAGGGPVRGVGGRFRQFVEGEAAAVAGGLLGRGDSGSVQRVFVTNWPAGGGASFASSPAAGGIAAGPLAGLGGKGQAQFASQLAKQIGANIQQILAQTAPAGVAAPGGGAGGQTTTGALGPFEKQQARQAANRTTAGLESRLGAARSATAEAQQLIPVRSLSVAVGQIASTVFGGRGDAISRAKEANALASKATSAVSNFRSEEKKLLEISAKLGQAQDPAKQKLLIEQRREQAKATQLAYRAAKDLTDQAEGASQKIIGQAGALRNLAAGTVGVVAGTLGFSAALGIAQAGLSAVTQIVGPAIERLSGFTATSSRVTSQLAEQVKEQNGATDTVIAAAAAQAGLSKNTEASIGPLLAQRAATESGNKTLQQGLDLLHTFEDARKRGGQQGLTSTTGGFLGSIIGGTASTQEIIKNEFNDSNIGAGAGGGGVFNADVVRRAQEAKAAGKSQVGVPSLRKFIDVDVVLGEASDSVKQLTDRVDFFNEQIKRGGENMKFVANASEDVAESFARTADRAGFTEIGAAARGPNHVILVDQAGNPLSGEGIGRALSAVNTGVNTPDPALLIKQLTERLIPAQKAQFRAEGNFNRNVINPGQAALGELSSPTAGLGGTPFDAGLVGAGDKAGAAAAAKYKTEVGGAVSYVNDQIAKGHDALIDLVPPDLRRSSAGSSTTSRRPASRSPRSRPASSSSRSTFRSPSTTTSCGSRSDRFRTRATFRLGSRVRARTRSAGSKARTSPPAPAPAARLRASAAPDQLQARDRRVRRPRHDAGGARGADRGGQEGSRVRPEAARHPEAARQQPAEGRQDRGRPIGH